MTQNISSKTMYEIINKTLSECFSYKGLEINKDMEAFASRHWEFAKNTPQLSFLDEEIPTTREVREASDFCELLDVYRQSIDPYLDENPVLSESRVRSLLKGIEKYRPIISEKNQTTYKILEKNLKRDLPEYKNELIIEELNEDALYIVKQKKIAF